MGFLPNERLNKTFLLLRQADGKQCSLHSAETLIDTRTVANSTVGRDSF